MAGVIVESLAKAYGDHTVIDGLDIEVRDGEFLTLLGPSGCGKTTTLRCVAGLEVPNEGSIKIGDKSVFDGATARFVPPQERDLGMVFQSYALWPHMTVFQNVAYPLRMRKVRSSEIASRVQEALELVSLVEYADRPATALSGGQQQRVALARAIVGSPEVLLYDEPLSNLDAKLRGRIRNLLLRLHRKLPITSIYVTHDQLEAITLSDRIIVMKDGAIEQIGTPRDLYTKPVNSFVANFIGFDNIFSASIVDREEGYLVFRVGSDAQTIKVADQGDSREGASSAQLAVRAERVLLSTSSIRPDSNSLLATIEYSVYLGDRFEVAVRLGEDVRLISRSVSPSLATSLPDVGGAVWVTLVAEDIVVLPSV